MAIECQDVGRPVYWMEDRSVYGEYSQAGSITSPNSWGEICGEPAINWERTFATSSTKQNACMF